MKMRILVMGLLCMTALFIVFSLVNQACSKPDKEMEIRIIPTSLDNLYPPGSPAPVYFIAMLDLATPFSGTMSDVLENDWSNAMANFESFKELYIKTSAMVPEWQHLFPMKPLEVMESALATRDMSKIMLAAEEVGKVCHHCHVSAMAPVQQRFRWDRFDDIMITDPLSGQDVGFAQLMLMMETNFAGIGVDLKQGQKENALNQLAGFKARFQTVQDACMICHDSERKYFTDKSIMDIISNIELELDKAEINGSAIGGLLQSIGQESCSKCHLVHIPAAYAQKTFDYGKH